MKNTKKLESWIKDLLYEENARLDSGIECVTEDIVNTVLDWLEGNDEINEN